VEKQLQSQEKQQKKLTITWKRFLKMTKSEKPVASTNQLLLPKLNPNRLLKNSRQYQKSKRIKSNKMQISKKKYRTHRSFVKTTS